MADAYLWNGSSGGSWGSAANWIDETTEADPATAVPGSGDPVAIAGPTWSICEVISDGGSSASLGLIGYVDLSGRYGTGGPTVGAVSGAPNTVPFTADGLALVSVHDFRHRRRDTTPTVCSRLIPRASAAA
jgi:hypothetical protein